MDEPLVRVNEEVKPKRHPSYAVIIENDDFHTFAYVIFLLQEIFDHVIEDATRLAKEVHEKGKATVWTGVLEVAELKRELIQEYGEDTFAIPPVTFPLGVRIEPLDN